MVIVLAMIGCSDKQESIDEGMFADTGANNIGDNLEDDTDSLDMICESIELLPERSFLPLYETYIDRLAPCSEVWQASAAGEEMMVALVLQAALNENEVGLEIRIENLLGEPILDWQSLTDFSFPQRSSGEFLIGLRNSDSLKDIEYRLEIACQANCDSQFTRYPLFFMHGLAGFDTLLSVFDYWNGIEETLTDAGYNIEIRGVSAFDPTPVRAEQWRDHLEELFLQTGVRKVNLIAHSQGGLDARYYATMLDDDNRIASITTIATPHYGTSIAGLLSGIVDAGPTDGQIIDALVSGAAELFGTSGDSFSAQLTQMTPENMGTFNQDVVDVVGIQYFSWAGRSCRYLQWSCQGQLEGETVSSYFLLSHAYIETQEGYNDGLVPVSSAMWGDFLGTLPADHIDQVGHRFDLSIQALDAPSFYLSEAERLAEAGL